MKRLSFILATSLLVFTCCEDNLITGSPDDPNGRTYKDFTLEVHAVSPEGSTWRLPSQVQYYSQTSDSLKKAEIRDRNGRDMVSLELRTSDQNATVIASEKGIIGHSAKDILVEGIVEPEQNGDYGSASLFLSKCSVSGNTIRLENAVSFLKVEVRKNATRRLVLHSADNAVLHYYGLGLLDFASGSFKPLEDSGCSISMDVSGTGTYYFAVFPGTFQNGLVIESFDASGKSVFKFTDNTRLALERGEVADLGVIDYKEENRIEENKNLYLSGMPDKLWYKTPFTPTVMLNGKSYQATFESLDQTISVNGGTLKPNKTGRHRIKATIQAEEHLWYYKTFDLDIYDTADFYMRIQAKNNVNTTYGNSQVVLYYSGLQAVTIEFGVMATAKPLVGSTKTEWLYSKKKVTINPGETVVLADYQSLSSWVKSHLTATLSLDVYLTCDDQYTITSFNADNIRENLNKSTSKKIEFRYNGMKLW